MDLLHQNKITAVCDVRSIPYSQYTPQFNREPLQQELVRRKITYVYLGKELGARSENPHCYRDGQVQFDQLAKEPLFLKGLDRLRKGMQIYRIALLCAEKDPLMCHRTILVCRSLRAKDIEIHHILEDGTLEHHAEAEKRLMALHKLEPDMFYSEQRCIEDAYDKQAQKIAYIAQEQKAHK